MADGDWSGSYGALDFSELAVKPEDQEITGIWTFDPDLDSDPDTANKLRAGYNPSVELWPASTSKWAALDFVVVTGRGGGNRVHTRSINLTHPGDPPELVFRRGGDNNVYGPNEDGTGFQGASQGSGLGHIAWQALVPQGSFQNQAAKIGASVLDTPAFNTPTVTLAESVTMPQNTIVVNEDMDDLPAYSRSADEIAAGVPEPDNVSMRESGQVRIEGETITYGSRSSTKLFGCTVAGLDGEDELAADLIIGRDYIELVDASTFTASGGRVQIESEIIDYTSVDRITFANDRLLGCTRGIEGTTDSEHSAGVTVLQISENSHIIGGDPIYVVQRQAEMGGEVHIATSRTGTASDSKHFQVNPDSELLFGEGATQLGNNPPAQFNFKGGGTSFIPLGVPQGLSGVVCGTAGATSYTYKVYAVDKHGKRTTADTEVIANGPATLSETNYIRLDWAGSRGAHEFIVERSASGGAGNSGTTGSLTTTHKTRRSNDFDGDHYFCDLGEAASAFTPPSRNETADVEIDGRLTVKHNLTLTEQSANPTTLPSTSEAQLFTKSFTTPEGANRTKLHLQDATGTKGITDESFYLSGLIEDRPAAGVVGRQYRATDTGIYYYDGGSNWNATNEGVVLKTADETVVNNTIQQDNELWFYVHAGTRWVVRTNLIVTSPSTNSDFKMRWTVNSTGATGTHFKAVDTGIATGSTPITGVTLPTDLTFGSANGTYMIQTIANISVATAGYLELSWAQNTTTAENTTVEDGSNLLLRQLV